MRAPLLSALATVVALTAAACSSEEPAAYDEAFRGEFTTACVDGLGGTGGADQAEAVCGCWHDRIVERIPIDELAPIDELMARQIPDEEPGAFLNPGVDPLGMLAGCVRSFQAMDTIPPTTAPQPTVPQPGGPPSTATSVPVP